MHLHTIYSEHRVHIFKELIHSKHLLLKVSKQLLKLRENIFKKWRTEAHTNSIQNLAFCIPVSAVNMCINYAHTTPRTMVTSIRLRWNEVNLMHAFLLKEDALYMAFLPSRLQTTKIVCWQNCSPFKVETLYKTY